MRGFIDLHSHWVAGVDDGAPDHARSWALIRALWQVGFDTIIATPHMRPGMFDNTAEQLRIAYGATLASLPAPPDQRPSLALASEHFFDDVVFQRFLTGEVLLYPGDHAALVEFSARAFPLRLADRLFDLMRRGIRPVIAHPERYEPVWRELGVLDGLLDGGAVLLLDVAALAGKYGRTPRRVAEKLVDAGYYQAACSDAHSAEDAGAVAEGIERLFALVGQEEAEFLLKEGPRQILEGRVED